EIIRQYLSKRIKARPDKFTSDAIKAAPDEDPNELKL
ncbi:unnamed protein product, partial [Amoebophrya sp. A25]